MLYINKRKDKKMKTKQDILKLIRDEELLETLNDTDRYEIALAVLGHSEYLYNTLETAILNTQKVEDMGFRFVFVDEILSHRSKKGEIL